ncbi:MAG: hypothetical protein WDM79_13185 [Terricaulis sp.]
MTRSGVSSGSSARALLDGKIERVTPGALDIRAPDHANTLGDRLIALLFADEVRLHHRPRARPC